MKMLCKHCKEMYGIIISSMTVCKYALTPRI